MVKSVSNPLFPFIFEKNAHAFSSSEKACVFVGIDMSSYPIPAARLRTITEIKRSRFITTLIAASDQTDVTALLDELRSEFPDASHHCWAYLLGAPKSSAHVGMSDDGEPKGTAGRPMLNILLHAEVGDVAVVVTRYFGGTKLGTGGLMRAYSDCVKEILTQISTTPKVSYQQVRLRCQYAQLDQIQRLTQQIGGQITHSDYQQDIYLSLAIPQDQLKSWRKQLPFDIHINLVNQD